MSINPIATVKDGDINSFREFAVEFSIAYAVGAASANSHEEAHAARESGIKDTEKLLDSLQRELAELKTQDGVKWVEKFQEHTVQLAARERENRSKTKLSIERLESMLEDAKAWEAPTAEHERMKLQMVNSLQRELLSSRCDVLEHDRYTSLPTRHYANAGDFRDSTVANVELDVKYLVQKLDSLKRAHELQTKWMRDLYDSLPK